MALQVKYFAEDLKIEFPEAYVKILGGSFSDSNVDYVVALYSNSEARKSEKTLNSKILELEKVEEDLMLSQRLVGEWSETLGKASLGFKLAKNALETKAITEAEFEKAGKDLQDVQNSMKKAEKKLKDSKEASEALRAEIAKLPIIKPLFIQKYSFKFSEAISQTNGVFNYGYNKLKEVPEYKNYTDI